MKKEIARTKWDNCKSREGKRQERAGKCNNGDGKGKNDRENRMYSYLIFSIS